MLRTVALLTAGAGLLHVAFRPSAQRRWSAWTVGAALCAAWALFVSMESHDLPVNLYTRLAVPRHAKTLAIRRAYILLAKRAHPDKQAASDAFSAAAHAAGLSADESSTDLFSDIRSAYDILLDEGSREAFNRFGGLTSLTALPFTNAAYERPQSALQTPLSMTDVNELNVLLQLVTNLFGSLLLICMVTSLHPGYAAAKKWASLLAIGTTCLEAMVRFGDVWMAILNSVLVLFSSLVYSQGEELLGPLASSIATERIDNFATLDQVVDWQAWREGDYLGAYGWLARLLMMTEYEFVFALRMLVPLGLVLLMTWSRTVFVDVDRFLLLSMTNIGNTIKRLGIAMTAVERQATAAAAEKDAKPERTAHLLSASVSAATKALRQAEAELEMTVSDASNIYRDTRSGRGTKIAAFLFFAFQVGALLLSGGASSDEA